MATNRFNHAKHVESVIIGGKSDHAERHTRDVVTSWKRCLESLEIDPGAAHRTTVLEHQFLKERRAKLETILDVAHVEMENLYQQIAGSGYAIILTDRDGVIVNCVGDPALDQLFRQSGLWLGALWDESNEGTNGIGTCIVERSPVTIHRDDHFRANHTALTCSGAPIFDPHGQLLAVLDASAVNTRDTKQSQSHTLALVNMSARLIENCNFLRSYPGAWLLRFHSRPEYVGLLNEGIVVIDDTGTIVAVNRGALHQIECTSRDELTGRPVEEIFDLTLSLIHERAMHQSHTVWPVRERRNGRRFFAMLRGPEKARSRTKVSASAASSVSVPSGGTLPYMSLRALAGDDPRMSYNVRCAERVVNRGISILLQGETGTGKEAFARAIHNASDRADKPYVAVNCASIPESLIESELFGYKHGAFTGARREGMRGKIIQSNGGTLFLDEIGDMPQPLQTRLLRVLEEKEVLPLGCETAIPVDLQVISATHRDLPSLVTDAVFREDLYYRLNGIALNLPPLRDREDRDGLIRSALAAENQFDHEVAIDERAFWLLVNYTWPGNIRQLRNVLRTALALCDEGVIRVSDLPPEIVRAANEQQGATAGRRLEASPAGETLGDPINPLDSAERDALIRALDQHRWNVTSTAETLEISRNTLYRKMKKHGISPVGDR